MEFSNRAAIAGVSFRRIEHPQSSQHITAEVVVIDKSNEVLQPLLYYLHVDGLKKQMEQSSFYPSGSNPIESHDFMMAGEVMGIDKSKKMIYVKNNITVSFKHLIVASGFKKDPSGALHDHELSAGLGALIEALKIRKNTSETLKFSKIEHLGLERNQRTSYAIPVRVKGIPVKRLQAMMNPSIGQDRSVDTALNGTEKRLYEVVL